MAIGFVAAQREREGHMKARKRVLCISVSFSLCFFCAYDKWTLQTRGEPRVATSPASGLLMWSSICESINGGSYFIMATSVNG